MRGLGKEGEGVEAKDTGGTVARLSGGDPDAGEVMRITARRLVVLVLEVEA